jgi:hypothetical protein
MTRSLLLAILVAPALCLAGCPDKDGPPPVEEEGAAARESTPPPPGGEARVSRCECTCESEGCRCAPLGWREGCACYDREFVDCRCDCKGETIVPASEITVESYTLEAQKRAGD